MDLSNELFSEATFLRWYESCVKKPCDCATHVMLLAVYPMSGTECLVHTMHLWHQWPAIHLGQNSNQIWRKITCATKMYCNISKYILIAAERHTLVQQAMQLHKIITNYSNYTKSYEM